MSSFQMKIVILTIGSLDTFPLLTGPAACGDAVLLKARGSLAADARDDVFGDLEGGWKHEDVMKTLTGEPFTPTSDSPRVIGRAVGTHVALDDATSSGERSEDAAAPQVGGGPSPPPAAQGERRRRWTLFGKGWVQRGLVFAGAAALPALAISVGAHWCQHRQNTRLEAANARKQECIHQLAQHMEDTYYKREPTALPVLTSPCQGETTPDTWRQDDEERSAAGAARDPPYSDTLFVNSELVTAEDPSCFHSIKAEGMGTRTMYDRRIPGWSQQQAYLFQAAYDDGLNIEVQVNTEFGESSGKVALEYARIIGQLPTALREDVDTVWIHRGKKPFGGRNRNLLIHTEQAAEYVKSGILEETLIHEASHTSLDEAHARSQGWMKAQQADGSYISQYAQKHPLREDLAESFLLFLGAEHLADRMDPGDLQTVKSTIPHRIAYFHSLNLDLYPLVASPKTR